MTDQERREEVRRDEDKARDAKLANLEESVKRIEDLLTPISATYTTATVLGKWFMGLAVFVSITIGIVLSVEKLFHK